jgi:malonyl CoA-acyl carrier protein transacylase
MKSFEQLARAAFEAHIKEVERQGAFTAPYRKPAWEELQPEFKQGWIAATKQIVAEMATVH